MARRNTPQRQLVLDVVQSLGTHPTADEVLAAAREKMSGISRATIYNDLAQLVEDGLVTRVRFPGEPDRFDRRQGAHAHFRCDVCGTVYDYDDPLEVSYPELSPAGFDIAGCDVYLHGTCKTCRDRSSRQQR